jgi:hypothetical protein
MGPPACGRVGRALLSPGPRKRRADEVTKRYDEPIEVRADSLDAGAPSSFTWRGRRYDVDQRLGCWREAGEWWNGSELRDREYHRLLARPAGALATGDIDPDGFMRPAGAVYDVYLDRVRGGWRITRVWD